ncbi:hypothetical protein [Azospirillum sp.]|uniref:hypothetical protein n=1 Tax=Azospirillum sp. TaxID=34012 RepID=UPI002D501854|nr:hypothetical protein [Azospirillum sp.]HYD68203.1 hypothetical protein [Azospirillum sp.]
MLPRISGAQADGEGADQKTEIERFRGKEIAAAPRLCVKPMLTQDPQNLSISKSLIY